MCLWHPQRMSARGPEAELQQQLIDPQKGLAPMLGWRVLHLRPARTKHGWRTPVEGDLGKGWPDLVLVRRDRVIFAELKSDTGKLTEEQRDVLGALQSAGMEVYVWRPRNIMEIADTLR